MMAPNRNLRLTPPLNFKDGKSLAKTPLSNYGKTTGTGKTIGSVIPKATTGTTGTNFTPRSFMSDIGKIPGFARGPLGMGLMGLSSLAPAIAETFGYESPIENMTSMDDLNRPMFDYGGDQINPVINFDPTFGLFDK